MPLQLDLFTGSVSLPCLGQGGSMTMYDYDVMAWDNIKLIPGSMATLDLARARLSLCNLDLYSMYLYGG